MRWPLSIILNQVVDYSEKIKMTKRNAILITLILSLLMLAQLIGGIGCQFGESKSGSLSDTAREAVSAQIKWLEEQKFEGPGPSVPLQVNLGSVESDTIRIGRDGGELDVNIGISAGGGMGVGGDGGGGGGGGGGG